MHDAEEEIREIKREIIESRGLIIKTNNLTNSLSADIKSIAKRQAGYERRFTWNGGVAYALFATLSFAGLKLWSDVRVSEIESESAALRAEVDELRRDLHDETRRAESRERAEAKSAAFYELVRQQRREEAVEQYEQLRNETLSRAEAAFFQDTITRFKADLSMAAYQNGLDLVRTARFAEAAEAFQNSVRLNDGATHIPAVKFNLAKALMRLNRHGEAAILAQFVIDQTIDRELQDDAAVLLSQCSEALGNLDEARNALKLVLRRWPRSALAADARKHLGELNKRIAQGGRP